MTRLQIRNNTITQCHTLKHKPQVDDKMGVRILLEMPGSNLLLYGYEAIMMKPMV